jgi:hypothetical protein
MNKAQVEAAALNEVEKLFNVWVEALNHGKSVQQDAKNAIEAEVAARVNDGQVKQEVVDEHLRALIEAAFAGES